MFLSLLKILLKKDNPFTPLLLFGYDYYYFIRLIEVKAQT